LEQLVLGALEVHPVPFEDTWDSAVSHSTTFFAKSAALNAENAASHCRLRQDAA